MLNDKLIIELSVNHIYHIDELKDTSSSRYVQLMKDYQDIKIVDIQQPFIGSSLNTITIQDTKSKDTAIIYEGFDSMSDWRNDNLNSFLNKSEMVYDVALKYFEYIERKGYRIAYIGGSSLGGGCAQFVSTNYPHVRAICINASPLNKMSVIDSNNIIHLRVDADVMYRAIALDSERYENGYVGNIIKINRSLYGSYDQFNHLELAVRGSISLPKNYLYNNYRVDNLTDLKNVVMPSTYDYFNIISKAPTLSSYISFDLLSNNLLEQDPTPPKFNFDDVQDNFSSKVKEIQSSFNSYLVPLMKLKQHNEFIEFNNALSPDLKGIVKYALLSITKQDSHLYDNIHYVIEKSADYIYKRITTKLDGITKDIDPQYLVVDQQKMNKDVEINVKAINNIIDALIKINNELFDYERFKFKNIFKVKNNLEFKTLPTPWAIEYKSQLFDKIDDAIKSGIVTNRLFIEQIEKLVFNAIKNQSISLKMPFSYQSQGSLKADLEYITSRYDLANSIEDAVDIFINDIHEIVLGESSFYNYLISIKTINQQLEYVLISLDNLLEYLALLEISANNKKHLEGLVTNTKNYINDLLYYNSKSLILSEQQ
ncbi:hypothetical protein [Mycoplasma sp. P36-A1]|uniref:hypothetical protein n=1 Tax=Mycoplasma sp. P36-A1 TaxID=3252900 RepID=UPI003C2E4446